MADSMMTSVMDPQIGCALLQLPLEVLTRITYFITTTELTHMRLSCKALEQALFKFFSHEFFRKKQFLVSSDSLQALVNISQHPTLSPVLKHVIISAERITPGWHHHGQQSEELRARLELVKADHMNLLATGALHSMLEQAFVQLPNLETVDIRDFNSPSRTRDGIGSSWRSYGSVTLAASTGVAVTANPHGESDPYITQLFCAVTAALATAQARPKSLEVLIRTTDHRGWGLHDSAFYIPPCLKSSVTTFLSSLRSLHLSLHPTRGSGARPFMIQNFLSLACNLNWLRLNFSHVRTPESETLLSWLALKEGEKPETSFEVAPFQLQHLERLDLGNIETGAETLVKLAAKFAPTLTSLYLRRVRLFDKENQNRPKKINPWVACLSALARIPGLNLRILDLSTLSHSYRGFYFGNVSFRPTDTGLPVRDWTCSTSMVTLDRAIADAIAIMSADFPSVNSAEDEDEDSSDADSELEDPEADGEEEDEE